MLPFESPNETQHPRVGEVVLVRNRRVLLQVAELVPGGEDNAVLEVDNAGDRVLILFGIRPVGGEVREKGCQR